MSPQLLERRIHELERKVDQLQAQLNQITDGLDEDIRRLREARSAA